MDIKIYNLIMYLGSWGVTSRLSRGLRRLGALASQSTESALVLYAATGKGAGAGVYVLLGLYGCDDGSGFGDSEIRAEHNRALCPTYTTYHSMQASYSSSKIRYLLLFPSVTISLSSYAYKPSGQYNVRAEGCPSSAPS